MQPLIDALLVGDASLSLAKSQSLLSTGVNPELIITEGIQVAMDILDHKCTLEQFNLLEIMLTGRAAMGVIKSLFPEGSIKSYHKGTVVLATLEGDIHDLGRQVLGSCLIGNGFNVIDCGKNVPLSQVIDTIYREKAIAVFISGLITSVIPLVQQLRFKLNTNNLEHVIIIAGGSALKQTSKEFLNVDQVCQTAFEAIHYLNSRIL